MTANFIVIYSVLWIQILSDPDSFGIWIRIFIQSYKMKGKAEFNRQLSFFFVGNYIF